MLKLNFSHCLLITTFLLFTTSSSSFINGSNIIINPWILNDRIWLYNTILNSTKIPTLFGDDNLGNYLWGLEIQMKWQSSTSRLGQPDSQTIDISSWWADMNYYLSVVPYLGASKVGLVPIIDISWPTFNSTTNKFCGQYDKCSEPVQVDIQDWADYFELIKEYQVNSPNSTTKPLARDQLLKSMWKAHTTSIKYAMSIFTKELPLLGVKEANFGNGWGNFVEVLSIVEFETNFTQVSSFSKSLPPRRLRFFDTPPFIFDMTKEQNNVVASILGVHEMATKLPLVWNAFLSTLKLMTNDPQCKALINNAVESFVSSPFSTLIETLIELLKGC